MPLLSLYNALLPPPEKKHGVSPELMMALETSPDEPEQKKLAERETEMYGRPLKVSERIALAKHAEAKDGLLPSLAPVPQSAVPLVKREKLLMRFKDRDTGPASCALLGTLRVTPAIGFFVGAFAWWDISNKRLVDGRLIARYGVAVAIPFLSTLFVGNYCNAMALQSLKPMDSGNLRRGQAYHAAGAATMCALPFFTYHFFRHVIRRPKSITRAGYWNKICTPLVPFKPGQTVGLYKPYDVMTAWEWGMFHLLFACLAPMTTMLYSVLAFGGDGDGLYLGETSGYAALPAPNELLEHIKAAEERRVAKEAALTASSA